MNVALIYGLAEGPRISKHFRKVLIRSGHKLVSPVKAQVIIAHSGGSYLLPDSHSAQVVVLVDVPYYDNHISFIKKLLLRVLEEGLSVKSIYKLGWNIWYFYSQPKRVLRMYRATIAGKFHGVSAKKVILIRNRNDVFGLLDQDRSEAKKSDWITRQVPGTHDDIWENPDIYIKLAEEYL